MADDPSHDEGVDATGDGRHAATLVVSHCDHAVWLSLRDLDGKEIAIAGFGADAAATVAAQLLTAIEAVEAKAAAARAAEVH